MMVAQAVLPSTSDRNDWSPEEAARIEAAGLVFVYPYDREGHAKGDRVLAPRPIVEKFLHTVARTGLDPLARQIYCIPRLGRDGIEWSIQTAIDGFRVIAGRSGQYAGQEPAGWLTSTGEWVDVFVKSLHGDHPLAAKVTVHRHDWDIPLTAVATWDEYAQTTSQGSLTAMWSSRGPGQLAKCAEALALRKAFPQDLSGLYTDDEMGRGEVLELGETPAGPVPPSQRSRVRPAAASEAVEGAGGASADAGAAVAGVTLAPALSDVETNAAGEVVSARVDSASLGRVVIGRTFECSECGEDRAMEEGGICGVCEDAILAGEAAAAEDGDGADG